MVFLHNWYHLVISFIAHNTNDYITNYQTLSLADILVSSLDIFYQTIVFTK